jgi:hypothetical protein
MTLMLGGIAIGSGNGIISGGVVEAATCTINELAVISNAWSYSENLIAVLPTAAGGGFSQPVSNCPATALSGWTFGSGNVC